jgi:hypothetical protein
MRLALPAALALALFAAPTRADEAPVKSAPPVDLAICLDTSGSMEGLIHAARQKIWSVVSELATAKPTPRLRVALLTYGTPTPGSDGDVLLQTGLTEDLDLVSEKLFALGTNGGEELVGRVVSHAIDDLDWSAHGGVRIVFVAGNESADQDQVKPFRAAAERAVGRGLIVNAIYCGGADDPDAAGYRELAALGRGRFSNIDHDHGTVEVATPFDEELAKLSGLLNTTYIAYGEGGAEARRRQEAQDKNAEAAGAPAAAERAQAKGGDLYRNGAWDLVDRMGEEGFDLSKIPEADLPEEMRAMTLEARLAHIEAKKKERADLQAKITDLASKRLAFVQAEIQKQGLDDSRALDKALRDAIREQASSAGFAFDAPR